MSRPALLLSIQVTAVIGILASLVALAALHPRHLDLTPEQRFTLSARSRDVVRQLAGDVRLTAFTSSQEAGARQELADLLALYRDAGPRITVRVLDLDRSPGLAQRLGVGTYDTVVVEAGERIERVEIVNEESLTAALLAVGGTPPVRTYFVVGHGEHDPRDTDERRGASDAARALAAEGFETRTLDGAAAIPPDAGLLVLAGPTHELAPAETDALAAWLARGGHALVLADPGAPRSLTALLRRFGIELAADIVVDERARLVGGDGRSARVAYLNEALVGRPPEVQALLPVAQSLRIVDGADVAPDVHADYLAMTAEATWADVDRRAEAAFRPDRDRTGPLPVAALARVGDTGRLAVVGDADFVSNLHLGVLGNRDLLLATASVATRGRALGGGPPTRPGGTFSPLALTAREARLVFWTVVVAPSALSALAALMMARRRRLA
jgi:ABC-type uncharacterized transport system involved in gliding motility auxiliary subunit